MILSLPHSRRTPDHLTTGPCPSRSGSERTSLSFSSKRHRCARRGLYALRPVSQQSPQGCPRSSASICLFEHRWFSILKGGVSAASFLHSSFLQAINAVMLWLVRVEKVPQASEHLCPAKLQTRCDICCACQSVGPFIPTDSSVPRTVDPQKSLQPKTVHGCVSVGAAHSRLHLLQQVHRVCENDGMCNLCVTQGG